MSSQRVDLSVFVRALVTVSEKAANVARCCRAEESLFKLLVQEKGPEEKNYRFIHDFKTLADVLVQEMIRSYLDRQFAGLGKRTFGEESSHFTSNEGTKVSVSVGATEADTAQILSQLVGDDNAQLMAKAVHQDVQAELLDLGSVHGSVDLEKVSIWIDPIDSTSEYIHGRIQRPNDLGLVESGLQCACVLIGAFYTKTGSPVAGVVNQPFVQKNIDTNQWTGKFYWGTSTSDTAVTSLPVELQPTCSGVVLTSSSESHVLLSKLQQHYIVEFAAGAGYKLLAVALGLAEFYVLSKGTTFRWDSCATHALLLGTGGGIVSYQKAIRLADPDKIVDSLPLLQLSYHRPEQGTSAMEKWCNKDGLIAYRDPKGLGQLVRLLQSK